MKFKLLAGAALAAVFAASGASAQVAGWYGAVDLGYHLPEGIEADSSNKALTVKLTTGISARKTIGLVSPVSATS